SAILQAARIVARGLQERERVEAGHGRRPVWSRKEPVQSRHLHAGHNDSRAHRGRAADETLQVGGHRSTRCDVPRSRNRLAGVRGHRVAGQIASTAGGQLMPKSRYVAAGAALAVVILSVAWLRMPGVVRAQAPAAQSGSRTERTTWYFYRVKWG